MNLISRFFICLGLLNAFIGPLLAFTPTQPGREIFPVPAENDVLYSFGRPSKIAFSTEKFKILVWNVKKGSKDDLRDELNKLASDRDLVITQEILLDENMMDTFKLFPNFYFSNATSFFIGKEKNRTGVSTFGPVEPKEAQFIRTKSLEPIASSPKVTLITRYPIAGSSKLLTIVNVHGINFVSNQNFLNEIDRIYNVIKTMPSPLILTGDFNTWNEARLDILNDYRRKLGLKTTVFNPDFRMRFNGNPLDHFLHTKDLKIVSAKVERHYQGSDHKPLEVEVEYLSPANFTR